MKKDSGIADNENREQMLNSTFTAKPKSATKTTELIETDGPSEKMDYGTMNLKDAIESGYTDDKGLAVSKAKEDVPGSPTGAWTDIGAGRSSVVRKHH